MIFRDKNKKLLLVLLILVVVLIFLGFKNSFFEKKPQVPFQNNKDNIESLKEANCSVKTKEMIVQGDSMAPLIEPGQTIKALFGYYNCHKVKRGDVILFKYAGNKNLIIKIVKGTPGDSFQLEKTSVAWNLYVNNKLVVNSENKAYLLSGVRYKMLHLYEKSYKGIIPSNAYLVLGNKTSGTLDSTRIGLIGKKNIVAKVQLP